MLSSLPEERENVQRLSVAGEERKEGKKEKEKGQKEVSP
jgi:hypothetical protein